MSEFKAVPKNRDSKQPHVVFTGSNPFDSDESSNNTEMEDFSFPTPQLITKHPTITKYPTTNPFDDDDDSSNNTEMEDFSFPTPQLMTKHPTTNNPFDDEDDVKQIIKRPAKSVRTRRIKHESRGLDKSDEEETNKTIKNCVKIAEDMRDEASKTLVVLHQQGEQITRTHKIAADMDGHLSKSEKLLGSLTGIFSRKWKPTKISGIFRPLEKKKKKKQNNPIIEHHPQHTVNNISFQKLEMEKTTKQEDDALSGLSNLLDELKNMAVDMGSEIDRQNKTLIPFLEEVHEINSRVKDASRKGHRLLGK